MAPIHHHFELSGLQGIKVVELFTIATAVLCLLGFVASKNLFQEEEQIMDFKIKKHWLVAQQEWYFSCSTFKKLGAEVTIQDAKTEDKLGDVVSELKSEGINLFLGANPDDIVEGMDILVMSWCSY